MMATFMAIMIPRAAVCADRICEVLDTESSVAAARPQPVTDVPAAATLELRGRRVRATRAPRRRCCATSRFRAEPGRTTAIIGSTGAGKTTLLDLIPRLFDVTGGARAASTASTSASWRRTRCGRRIGLVPQKPYLFSGTVASNLRYGNPDATDDELWAALEVAQARDFVAAMPGGSTRRSRRAARTSPAASASGSRSRGRWCASREIYLFDDSFSALDLAHRRPAAGRAARRGPRDGDRRDRRRPAGLDHRRRRPDRRARGRRGRRARARTSELLATCPTYPEIVESQLTRRRRRHEPPDADRRPAAAPARPPAPPPGGPDAAAARSARDGHAGRRRR